MGVTPPSPWPWVDHPASGLPPPTERPVRTRFPSGSAPEGLSLAGEDNSRAHYAKGTPSGPRPETRDPPTDCRRQVSGLFTPLPGCFSPFPHGTGCAIGRRDVFSLGRWSARIPTGFHVPRGTREHGPGSLTLFAYGAVTLYGPAFQHGSAKGEICHSLRGPGPPPAVPHDPAAATALALARQRFRLLPFRSPLLGESMSLSFPPPTEMFHFGGFASLRVTPEG